MITAGVVSENRKARFAYEIEETLEAGLILTGAEVKALRLGRVNISRAYAAQKSGDLYLINSYIGDYAQGNFGRHENLRPRKLLVHKREKKHLEGVVSQKGYTLVPLVLYFNKRGLAKLKLGVGRGKNVRDKRETIKQRDWNRDKERLLKKGVLR